MKFTIFGMPIVVAILLLGSCGGHGIAPRIVAFAQANNAEPYRAAQIALMKHLLAQTPDVQLVVSDAQQDNSRQVAQIETFIRQKPAVLIVAPNERAALTAVMGEAMQAGIPVICLERDILQPNYTTYIQMDNRAIGRMAGQFMVEQLTKNTESPGGTWSYCAGFWASRRRLIATAARAKYWPGFRIFILSPIRWPIGFKPGPRTE